MHGDTLTDLVIDGQVITAIEDHPFWSVTDHTFEHVDQLAAGEKVLAADGTTLTVTGFGHEPHRTRVQPDHHRHPHRPRRRPRYPRAQHTLLRWSDARRESLCGIVTDLTPLHDALLELGLEDWIPLPEILDTPEVRPLVEGEAAIHRVSSALVDLLAQDLIQVWFGKWSDEPSPAPRTLAEELLLDERRYSVSAEDADLDRAYFVNVANFRVG
ncbi:hypothetical protein KIN34_14090 [Cellulomonas sp. DKR-3]|uniref:Uncharacterized protein n=1 Tax=Cellulomonas fulva TaxID=2835530 RepID=A0ABS5U1Y6_9CELL|nr:hypothetical protein [Cellulomonas fulva]MBT0995416.1 hypothetical protein [Cellulomonas fulva]